MSPDFGYLAPPPPLGRVRGTTIRPVRTARAFDVAGAYRSEAGLHRVTARVDLPADVFGFLVGDRAGRLRYAVRPEPGDVPLAFLRGVHGAPAAHHSWTWIFPPSDDRDAQDARAAYASGRFRIPGKDIPVGLPRRIRLDDMAPLVADRGLVRISTSGTTFRRQRLSAGTVVFPEQAPDRRQHGTTFRECHFDAAGSRLNTCLLAALRASPEAAATDLLIEDCTLTNTAPAPRYGGTGILFFGRMVVRRCLIERLGTGIYQPGHGSVFEDVHIRQCGLGPEDHADAIEAHAVRPGLSDGRGGGLRISGFQFSMPSSFSPDWDGTNTTGLLTLAVNAFEEHPFSDVLVERGLFDGGTYSIRLGNGRRVPLTTGRIDGLLVRNCFFTRNYAYDSGGVPGLPFNVHPSLGSNWGNMRFADCRWADSGERLDALEGTWNPGPGGVPLRAGP